MELEHYNSLCYNISKEIRKRTTIKFAKMLHWRTLPKVSKSHWHRSLCLSPSFSASWPCCCFEYTRTNERERDREKEKERERVNSLSHLSTAMHFLLFFRTGSFTSLTLFCKLVTKYSQTWVNDYLSITTSCLQRTHFRFPSFHFHSINQQATFEHLSTTATNPRVVFVHRFDCIRISQLTIYIAWRTVLRNCIILGIIFNRLTLVVLKNLTPFRFLIQIYGFKLCVLFVLFLSVIVQLSYIPIVSSKNCFVDFLA